MRWDQNGHRVEDLKVESRKVEKWKSDSEAVLAAVVGSFIITFSRWLSPVILV